MFHLMPYRDLGPDFDQHYKSAYIDPVWFDVADPDKVGQYYNWTLDEMVYAARAGMHGLCTNQHHQNVYGFMANPSLMGSALAKLTNGLNVAIIQIGSTLPSTSPPTRIAEEYALIDCVSGGRLVAGFPTGLPTDATISNGVVPVEQRERYREALQLVLKAWQAREVFAWNGRHYQLPMVNIWPRPIQQPHPPIWIPGTGSAGTLRDILRHDYAFVYLSWDGPKLTGREVFDRYWELAEQEGRDRNPYRLAFLQVVAVAETDERAEREYGKHLEAHYRSGLGAIPGTAFAVPGYAEPAAIEGMLRSTGPGGMLGRMKTATYKEIVDSQVAIVGSPATVADQIQAFVREFRIGNLLVMLQNGSMPRDLTEKNISLFAAEVLPRLRPIWDEEGWENPWWPRAAAPEKAAPEEAAPEEAAPEEAAPEEAAPEEAAGRTA